jgi:hypothetical protein
MMPRNPNDKEMLAMYDLLHKVPVEPPCDLCPNRILPDKVQGCHNAGCGFMHLFVAVEDYNKKMGWVSQSPSNTDKEEATC